MSLKITAIAVNQSPLDWTGNLQRLLDGLAQAKAEGTDVLCFPELAISGYGCEDLFLRKEVQDKCWESLRTLAEAGKGLLFAVGLPLQYKGNLYNTLSIVDSGQIMGFYAKQCLARKGVYYEPRWFDAWPAERIDTFERENVHCPIGEITYPYHGARIGFEICEDMWQKSRPATRYANQNATIILSAHASHFALGKHVIRDQIVRESTLNNDCLFVYTNLLGNDSGRLIYGGDLLMAHKGEVVAAAERFPFSPISVLNYQHTDEPVAANRVDILPSEEEEFTQAATLALFDYLRRSKAHGFVLSISGGADSAMCAALVYEMLRRGYEKLGEAAWLKALPFLTTGNSATVPKRLDLYAQRLLSLVYQASKHSSLATLEAARALSTALNIPLVEWSIAEEVENYTKKVEIALGHTLSWKEHDVALQNVQARARVPALWMLANVKNALLITTSNRSEGSVGYATMDGDMAGSLAPLASVSKVFILKWLQWAADALPCGLGLRKTNTLRPTAELRPALEAQSDEKDLMPYEILNIIEHLAIVEKHTPSEVLQILCDTQDAPRSRLKSYVQKFFFLWPKTQWKRERLAPSFHLGTFSIDPKSWYRFPILSAGYEADLAAL